MQGFDEGRFLAIQSGAVGLAGRIDAIVGAALANGAGNLFFLGTGGAAILMQPAVQLLQARSTFPTFAPLSAELVAGGSRHLGPQSLVVIPSLSGTTKESVAALEFCKARGATVVALVGHAGTPLAEAADHALVNFAEDDTPSESFYLQALFVALSVMRHRGEFDGTDAFLADAARLPEALLAAKRAFDPEAEALAERIRDWGYHIVTGAGATWPQAFYYGMCILEEMQWIRTRPVHASDFFHGTLELVEPGVSVILLKGEDAYRPLAERVAAFVADKTERLTVLDAAAAPLPGIAPASRALVSQVVLATMLERLSDHLARLRGHPLTTRRYYRRVAY
jgi:fructoselysine-6-phosphate deglycase